jgi:hypothetical protein
LQNFNGHIGYCSQHKWVSPVGLGFEGEAAEQNRQDTAAVEQSRLKQERQAQEAKAQEIREQHQSAVRKVFAVVVALALIAAAVVFFVVRPSVNYGNATKKFTAGEYQAAKDGYSALGDYKDSAARVLLCDAMIDLQEGRPEGAAAKLDQLTSEGQGDIATQLIDAILPVVADWKAKGLTPQALLLLLSKAAIIDPNGTLDVARLTEEGHVALLDGTQLSTYTSDVIGDGSPELIALNADYSVTVYRMTADGNVRMAVDNDVASRCEMAFGNQYMDTDVNASVACFSEAYRLSPGEDARAALTAAYQLRSASHENAGDMDAAIADARSAMETAGTADAFTFFYDINLRYCKSGHDAATAIAMWDAFAASSVTDLVRFSAKDRWQMDAAQLHIAHAAELAARKDEDCIAELRTAAGMGADVTGAIAEAESHFEPGFSLVRLRLLEIELLGNDAAKEQQIRFGMAQEVRAAIGEWKDRGIAPADVPALIHLADEQGIDLDGMDRNAIYEEAAVASAGNVAQHTFVDWDNNGYKELLTLDASGALSLYGLDEIWKTVSSVDTKLPGASYTIADESAPLILVLSSGKDELLAVTGTSSKLSALFRETGISRYSLNGQRVTFSRLLEGSIARYTDYAYEAIGTANRPVRTGVDWQQNDYPQPASAAAVIQRYFEARAYDIPEEAALLTAGLAAAELFNADALSALPAPDVPGTVDATAYQKQDGRESFEVTYPSGTRTVRTWVAVEYSGGWKLAGAADTYGAGLSTGDIDYSIPLISLNAETGNAISARGGRNTYRLLIPASGRIGLVWQSGSKAASRTSHTVTMYRGSLTGDTVFSFQLQPSVNKQQSKDMFVSAGVYYVTIEANISDAEPYHLTINFTADPYVELENNDISSRATVMKLNTSYSGTLSSAKDVDYYAFTLNAPSAVNVTFGIPGNGSKTTTHVFTVLRAADKSKLSTVSVPGNAPLTETGNLYLSSGTYLVQVAKGSAFTDDAYTLTVNAGQNGAMEAEPNNTPETANAIRTNEDVHASIGREGDVDCYTFTLASDAVVQPRFTFAPTDSSSKTYVLTIQDAGRREMLKVNIGGKESTKVIAPVALTAGTYTVKIENPRFVRQDYTLRLVSAAAASAEKEPNDSAALATVLSLGQPRTGVLTTDADIDYYKVTFAEKTTATLKFSFAQSTNKNTAFVLSVEQNGKTQWTVSIKGDSGGIEQQLLFPAGEYYIKIKSYAWLGAVYTITLQ